MKLLQHKARQCIEHIWYQDSYWRYVLWPCSLLFRYVSQLRRYVLSRIAEKQNIPPVIVVGNITVGGTGKTPLVIAIADYLIKKGYRVAVISRGYGGRCQNHPHLVQEGDDADLVGDEPRLMANRLSCPVVISPDRLKAIDFLKTHFNTEIIISDDGLQHYKMPRLLEIALVDADRHLHNSFCLPAGPFREPQTRLKEVDIVVMNGEALNLQNQMKLIPGQFIRLNDKSKIAKLPDYRIKAIAGIGNPQRFFNTLTTMGIEFSAKIYPDHYAYAADDLYCLNDEIIVMTEKDAVKCEPFATDRHYFLPVEAQLPESFWQLLNHGLSKKDN